MKPGKVLCYMFLFAILGVDCAQNLTKYNRWLRVFIQPTNRKNWDYLIHAWCTSAKQKMCTVVDLGLFVCCFYVCRVS